MEAPELSFRERIAELNPEAILWDGLDGALIGFTPDYCAVYDIYEMRSIFQSQGMSEEEADEWIDYNILSAFVGEYTPMHIWKFK